jgi:hypothetical protein
MLHLPIGRGAAEKKKKNDVHLRQLAKQSTYVPSFFFFFPLVFFKSPLLAFRNTESSKTRLEAGRGV